MNESLLKKSSESDLTARIREAIGAGADEEVLFTTPQFERLEPRTIIYTPQSAEDLNEVSKMPVEILKAMGLRAWDCEHGVELWCYPGEWYNYIPDGYEMVDIFWQPEIFKRGVSDDDIRFGVLPYGFEREKA